MNYACISDQPFVTTKDLSKRKPLSAKDLSKRKPLSEEARARREFIRTHSFAFRENPLTGEPEVIITEE